jgi:hypothetical protein
MRFLLAFSVRDGAAAQLLPLLFSRDRAAAGEGRDGQEQLGAQEGGVKAGAQHHIV